MSLHSWIADSGRLFAFAADGSLLVTGQWPERLTRYVGPAWDAHGHVELRDGSCALAASPEANEVCLGMKTAQFFDALTLKKRPGSLKGHKYELGAVTYAPDGWRVFSGGGGHVSPPDHSIRLFELAGDPIAAVAGPAGVVRQLAAVDSSVVVALDTADGLAAYDVAADQRRWLVSQPSTAVAHGPFAADPDEGRVYAALARSDARSSWVLAVLDARTGDTMRSAHLFSIEEHGHVDGVALVGSHVAVSMGQNAGEPGARKGKVHLFDRATLARGAVLEAEEQTGSLAASRDGRFLAAAMRDLGIAIFDMREALDP